MTANWGWFEDDGVTPNDFITYTPTNGVPTDPVVRRLYNNQPGDPGFTASGDVLLTLLSRNTGVGDFTAEDELAANGYVKARIVGSGGDDIENQTTGYTPLGKGRFMVVRDLPDETYREFEFIVDIPLGAGLLAKEFILEVIEGMRSFSLSRGYYEGGFHGLRMGLGDQATNWICYGFEVEAQSVPDNTVIVRRGSSIRLGVPYAVPEDPALAFDNLDSAAAALASGESYPVRMSLSTLGVFTTTKGVKVTDPVNEAQVPDVPEDHIDLGWLVVPFSAEITEIHQDDVRYGGALLVGTSLAPSIHPFEALIGNAIVYQADAYPIVLVDDATNLVWADPDGSITVADAQPSSRAVLIWEVPVASGSIVWEDVKDLRPWLYPNPVDVRIDVAGTLTGSSEGFGVLPCAQSAYLLPIGGVVFSVGDPGSSGANTIDVLAADRDGAFTTIFTGAEEVPSIAFDAAHPVDTDSMPQVLFFHGYTRFQVDFTAVGGGTPKAGSVVLRMSGVGAA